MQQLCSLEAHSCIRAHLRVPHEDSSTRINQGTDVILQPQQVALAELDPRQQGSVTARKLILGFGLEIRQVQHRQRPVSGTMTE